MGHSTTNSGAFRQRMAAMRDWKLIAGRGDSISMTDVAKLIALPDDAGEQEALRVAFRNCTIFSKLYETSQKGILLEQQGLGNRAVHAFGVSPSSVSKFVSSFVDSAVAAGVAEVSEDGRLTLLEPDDDITGPDEAAPRRIRGGSTSSSATSMTTPTGPCRRSTSSMGCPPRSLPRSTPSSTPWPRPRRHHSPAAGSGRQCTTTWRGSSRCESRAAA